MLRKWGDVVDTFNLVTHPKSARTAILSEMADGKRDFDATVLRHYASQGLDPAMELANRAIATMAIRHGVNDVASAMIDNKLVDLNCGIRVDLEGQKRVYGWHVFSRQLTDGELLLKEAAEAGNVEMIRKLHEKKVPADIETVETSGSRRLFVFRDLWKAGASQHLATVMPVLKELYPADASKHAANERGEVRANPGTVKSAVTQPLYT